MQKPEVKILPDLNSVIEEGARRVISAAEGRLADNQHFFSLILSGGHTPRTLYECLAADPYRSQLNWSKVEVYFGDERCVPPDHPDSNYLMAHIAMLSKLPVPEPNIHRMRGELSPEAAANEYGQMLQNKFHDSGVDMLLLGMGPDGHTASLFPHTPALNEQQHRCVANFAPSQDAWRITLTFPFLNKSKSTIMLVAGEDKADTLQKVLEGPHDPQTFPVQGIQPAGQVIWLVDAAAASKLKNQ